MNSSSKCSSLLNVAGFYDGLLDFWATMAGAGFVRPAHRGILIASDDLDDLLARMAAYVPHRPIAAMKADEL